MSCFDLDSAVLKDGLAGFDESRQMKEQGDLYIIIFRTSVKGRCPTQGGPVVAHLRCICDVILLKLDHSEIVINCC